MARISFSQNIRSHIDVEECVVAGDTVIGALEEVFARHDRLRGYVLDDCGAVRNHVVVFVDGKSVEDRERLSDVLAPEAEIFVMQALSGG